jgi:error-prone DNA polymerase
VDELAAFHNEDDDEAEEDDDGDPAGFGHDPDAAVRRHAMLETLAAAADDFNLIIGSRFTLTAAPGDTVPPPRLCCWPATARLRQSLRVHHAGPHARGEGQLSAASADSPIRKPASAHLRGMPDCLAILLPDYCADTDVLRAQARWCRNVFGERAGWGWNCCKPCRALHRTRLQQVSQETGVPVAAGAVNMHVRSRKPLADVLTAIRIGQPLPSAAWRWPQCRAHLRMRWRCRGSARARCWRIRARWRRQSPPRALA